jgi:hypothetical protein
MTRISPDFREFVAKAGRLLGVWNAGRRRQVRGSRFRLASLIVVLSALMLSCAEKESQLSDESDSTLGLTVSVNDLSIGDVWANGNVERTVKVSNRGNNAVNVTAMRASCTCTSISPPSFRLEPKEETTLTLNIRTDSYLGTPAGDELASSSRSVPFEVELIPHINGKQTSMTWHLHGIAHGAPIVPLEPSIELENLIALSENKEVVTRIRCGEAISHLTANWDDSLGEVALEQDPASKQMWILHFRPASNLRLGTYRCPVTVRAPPLPGSAMVEGPSKTITLTGIVRGWIRSIPDQIDFGVCEVGESRARSIALISQLGRSFDVADLQTDDESLSVTKLSAGGDGAGQLHSYMINWSPTTEGRQNAIVKFRFEMDCPDGLNELTVPATCFGLRTANSGANSTQ